MINIVGDATAMSSTVVGLVGARHAAGLVDRVVEHVDRTRRKSQDGYSRR